jgi:hypothetical protein
MTDIFISYARRDRDRIAALARVLGEKGWSIWWDRNIRVGSNFADVIAEELAAARCVIVAWSKDALKSKWVIDEAADGSDRGILLPILLDNVKPPLGFRQVQAISLSDWKDEPDHPGLNQLLSDIQDFLQEDRPSIDTDVPQSSPVLEPLPPQDPAAGTLPDRSPPGATGPVAPQPTASEFASPAPTHGPARPFGGWTRRRLGAVAGAAATILAATGVAFLALRPAPPAPPSSATAHQAQAPAKPPETPKQTTQAGPARQTQSQQVPSAQQSGPAQPLPADSATFQKLIQQGSIVPEPKTAPELYHNARLYEARGDAGQARRAYHALARLGHEHIDPHLRYAALLRVQDGRAGAREAYSALLREKPTRAAALVHALQFEGAERRAKVEAFAAQNPDYAPALYLLADEYSEDRIAPQSLTDRRLEFDALERFLQADMEGRLAPFFLDQSVLAQWLDKAKKRKEATEAFFQSARTKPTASFQRAPTGWVGAIHLPEPATALSVRVGETGEFKATGFLSSIDQRTGKPTPNPSLELPADQARTTLYVRYDDASGRTAGPFPIAFDPSAALAAAQRDVLERFPDVWVAFRPDRPDMIHFPHLVANRCAIERAEMGIDEGPLAIDLPIPDCEEANPYGIPADAKTFLPLPKGVRAVSVQLTYADGTQSDVRTFRR